MVLIRLLRDEEGRLAGFEGLGHALPRPVALARPGTDIVCAGISTLLQTTVAGLEQTVHARPSYRLRDGRLLCRVPRASRDGETGKLARVLLESMALGLREIERAHPGMLLIVDAPVWDRRPRPRIEIGGIIRVTIEKTASTALCEADGPCEVTPQKLMGVALLGALGSLALYYIYSSLSDETRQALKDNVTAAVKSNLAKLAQQ